MKGVVFTGMPGYQTFPSIAFGSGKIEKEDTYRYAKRTSVGTMRRIGYVGYTIRIQCDWAVLTAAQFDTLTNYIKQIEFDVQFRWQGAMRTAKFYAGNISAKPFKLDSSGSPRYYTDVSFPIISVGVFTI